MSRQYICNLKNADCYSLEEQSVIKRQVLLIVLPPLR